MGDGDIAASIKRTQEQLGKFVKKPPLTDKNLSRPPFRFLHDLTHNVIDTTGFMSGVFTPEELDAANATSRETKSAFMQKLIQAVKDKTGDDVPVKVSKILAGLEADKTNGLLQSLAKAIEVHQQENGGGAAPASTKKGAASKKPTASQSKLKTGAATKADPKKTGATGKAAPTEKKEGGSGGAKRTIRDPSPAGGSGGSGGRTAAKQGKTNNDTAPGSGGSKSKSKAMKPQATVEALPPASLEPSVPESIVNDETNDKNDEDVNAFPANRKDSSLELKANEMDKNVDLDNKDIIVGRATTSSSSGANSNSNNDDAKNGNANLGLYDNYAVSSALVKPNMQTLPPPTTPILTDADAVIATMTPPPAELPLTPSHKSLSLTPTPGPSLTPSPSPIGLGGRGRPPSSAGGGAGPRSLSREASAEQQSKGSPYGSAAIGEIRPPTGQQVRSRPDTGTSGRLSSARPPSARKPPPRPKSSVVREDVEPYRPTTGKVAHVIMDSTEDPDDDDNYIVREVTVTAASKPPGLSDLDETPELGIMGGGVGGLGGAGGELDSILPPDQRGLLVNQILETQKELEDKGKGGDDTPMIEKKMKELSVAEIDKLKNLIQLCARSANPLAKLLDYMAEDVDSMQKEYIAFREESKRLNLELEHAKADTEKFLQNLKHELNDIERKIKDKEDAILASHMKIIQQEERIEEIVVGFERVRSGKSAQGAKDHMPTAEEILSHIQGQTTLGIGGVVGGGGGFGGGRGGGPPSAFSFTSVGPMVGGSTPSSGTSGSAAEPLKIPDNFMVNGSGMGGNGEVVTSPFSRGRMWTGNNNNGIGANNATFDSIMNSVDDDDDQMGSMGATRRNTGRSGASIGMGGAGGGGGFRRSATTVDYPIEQSGHGGGGNRMDVDSFNPWS